MRERKTEGERVTLFRIENNNQEILWYMYLLVLTTFNVRIDDGGNRSSDSCFRFNIRLTSLKKKVQRNVQEKKNKNRQTIMMMTMINDQNKYK